jgi:predicted RNA-binding protein
MCLAKTYLQRDGESELLLQDVALVEVDEGVLRFSTLFGEKREVEGVIVSVDFQNGSVLVEKTA